MVLRDLKTGHSSKESDSLPKDVVLRPEGQLG